MESEMYTLTLDLVCWRMLFAASNEPSNISPHFPRITSTCNLWTTNAEQRVRLHNITHQVLVIGNVDDQLLLWQQGRASH